MWKHLSMQTGKKYQHMKMLIWDGERYVTYDARASHWSPQNSIHSLLQHICRRLEKLLHGCRLYISMSQDCLATKKKSACVSHGFGPNPGPGRFPLHQVAETSHLPVFCARSVLGDQLRARIQILWNPVEKQTIKYAQTRLECIYIYICTLADCNHTRVSGGLQAQVLREIRHAASDTLPVKEHLIT